MDSSFLCLVAGFLAGAIASGLLLFWIFNHSKKKQDASIEKRNQIIGSIAEIFTDIDSLITSFRTDLISEDKFRSSLYSKLDVANKIYKTNMHLLDLYYVKFTDIQFAKYYQLAHGKLTSLQLDGQIAFDNEIASIEKSSDTGHFSGSDKSNSQSTVGFFSDKPVKDSSESLTQTKNEELNATDDVCVRKDDGADNQIPDFEFISMGPDENQIVIDEQPVVVDEQPAIVDQKVVELEDELPAVADEQPVIVNNEQPAIADEQPVVAVEQPVIIDEKQQVISDEELKVTVEEEPVAVEDSKEADDLEDEIVFEVNSDKAANKKESPSTSNTTIEVSKNTHADESSDSFVGEEKSAFQKEFEQVAKEPQDEEMLETIMDLDMGKFLRTGSINIENIDKNALPPKYAATGRRTDESADKFAQTKENSSSAEVSQKTIQPIKETEKQEKIVIARGEDGSVDTILDEPHADAELNNKSDGVNDVAITGDDVASKIDSFFGIK